jgi:hypothetical protein
LPEIDFDDWPPTKTDAETKSPWLCQQFNIESLLDGVAEGRLFPWNPDTPILPH